MQRHRRRFTCARLGLQHDIILLAKGLLNVVQKSLYGEKVGHKIVQKCIKKAKIITWSILTLIGEEV
jgi:predicted N-acetyltransferase YhbS